MKSIKSPTREARPFIPNIWESCPQMLKCFCQIIALKVHLDGASATTWKNDFTIKVYVAAEVADACPCEQIHPLP